MGVEVEIYLFNITAYKDRFLPAYKAYFHNNDQAPLLILLEDTCLKLKSNLKLSKAIQWGIEDCENYIRVLREGIYIYSDKNKGITTTIEVNQKEQRDWARSSIFPALLEALCVPYEREDVYPELSLSDSAIGNYRWRLSAAVSPRLTTRATTRSAELPPALR